MKTKLIDYPMLNVGCCMFSILLIVLLSATPAVVFGQSTVQFSSASYTVAESAGAVALTVERLNDTTSAVSVDYATMDGTAINGLKYAAVAGTLDFGVGETNKLIVVPILNEAFVEFSKSFRVILSNPTGAVLGIHTNATVSITDNDVGVQFSMATFSIVEGEGPVMVCVVRGDDGACPITVDLATTDLTATSGQDYTGVTSTLSFGPTETFKLVPIAVLNDSLKEANETFRVTLGNPLGATLGNEKTATVTILDNDPGFQFESASYSQAEDAGVAMINVLRGSDPTDSTVTVDLTSTDLTAADGVDYVATNGTLNFSPGEKVKTVTVAILNDGLKEGTKSFRLTLSNPTGGAVLGSRSSTTVSIQDNDPGVGFEASASSVWEKAGEITLCVVRGNDSVLGPFTVDYATTDGTAVAGQDYAALSGTLQFEENQTVKSITVPILPDTLAECNETFRVTLSNPSNGAGLGTATATVSILEHDFTLAPPVDSVLTIRRNCGVNVLTWSTGGQLQRADQVTGPWQTLTVTTNGCVIQSPLPATFYRVTRPRPVNLFVPSGYDGHTPMPLVILLHGGHLTGDWIENYMHLRPLAEARGFLYCYPTGTLDLLGSPFWNAYFEDPAEAAAFGMTNVDDAAFLRSLIEEIAKDFSVDRKRVYLIGHSNGGFMAYKMAGKCADLFAGIASLAGTRFLGLQNYEPSEPVNILHIHGTADEYARYWGGAMTQPPLWLNSGPYVGAVLQVQTWASYDGASNPVTDASPSMDLTTDVAGLDTVVTCYTSCLPGGAVELWTINGGSHTPTLSAQFSSLVVDWLLAHPKP